MQKEEEGGNVVYEEKKGQGTGINKNLTDSHKRRKKTKFEKGPESAKRNSKRQKQTMWGK